MQSLLLVKCCRRQASLESASQRGSISSFVSSAKEILLNFLDSSFPVSGDFPVDDDPKSPLVNKPIPVLEQKKEELLNMARKLDYLPPRYLHFLRC